MYANDFEWGTTSSGIGIGIGIAFDTDTDSDPDPDGVATRRVSSRPLAVLFL
jgi:hypothetical protein